MCIRDSIDNVPLHVEHESVDWELRPLGENGVSLAPYPFRKSPLSVSILARRVPKRLYGDEKDFQRTLALASYFAVNFTLRAADEMTRNAVA